MVLAGHALGLDSLAIRRWCVLGLAALRRHRSQIDAMNVYPVPDADTGTNLVATFAAAVESVSAAHPDEVAQRSPAELLATIARDAAVGARGNSGAILSQILRGVSDVVTERGDPARGRVLAAAFHRGAAVAEAAIAAPVEGTMLSVAWGAAKTAEQADSDDLAIVATAAARGAADALARTPSQLPVLAAAGVVDAGGHGLLVLLDALVAVITGEPAPLRETGVALPIVEHAVSVDDSYEVQYMVYATSPAIAELRETLAGFGDSLVVTTVDNSDPDSALWSVHVHVRDAGAAVEAGLHAGRPHQISVTRLIDRFGEPSQPSPRGVVVVAQGAGQVRLFSEVGAIVVTGGPDQPPSSAEILAGIRTAGADTVVLMPNDNAALPAAEAAAREARTAGRTVSVVHTRSPVQAIAALAVADPARRFDDEVITMAEAAAATRWGALTVAARDALTLVGPCRAGQVLGLVEGEVVAIGEEPTSVGIDVLDRMLGGGGELVTLVPGAEAPAGLSEDLAVHLGQRWPFVEHAVYDGGQPHYRLLIGVE